MNPPTSKRHRVKHTKDFGVYFKYNGREVCSLVEEFNFYGDAVKYMNKNYEYETGTASVFIMDKLGDSIYVKRV